MYAGVISYEGINSWATHKQAQRPKGPTWQLDMRGNSAHTRDTSSIQSNSTSTNQTRARRSMDPPGHATDIVSCQVTKNRPKGPLISHVSKIGGERWWPEVDRPGTGPSRLQLPRVTSLLALEGSLRRIGCIPGVAPFYKYKGRG